MKLNVILCIFFTIIVLIIITCICYYKQYNLDFILGYWVSDDKDIFLYLGKDKNGYLFIKQNEKIVDNSKITFQLLPNYFSLQGYYLDITSDEDISGIPINMTLTLDKTNGIIYIDNTTVKLIKDNISYNDIISR